MNQIVISADLAAQLHQLAARGQQAQLVDVNGYVVARAEPYVDPAEYKLVGELEDEFTPEEIEQSLAEDQKCYTVEEVLARLRSLS